MMSRLDNQKRTRARVQRGFTMVEMLIVVAIVILLLSILLVAISAASRSGQAASTKVRMESMSRALVTFKTDMGYLPPILNTTRGLLNLPGHDPITGGYATLIQDYFSVTSMAEYLTGYGDRAQDGFGVPIGGSNTDTERPPFGIRDSDTDGVWGATKNGGGGTLAERAPDLKGDVFGPYLEMEDPNLLASIDGTVNPATGQLNVFFAGEAGYDETDPKVIVDFWGSPIRYHRLPYPVGGIRAGYMAVDRDGDGVTDRTPSLGDVFALRPFSVRPGEDIPGLPDSGGDTTTTSPLNAAEFALFSLGPDKAVNVKFRYDDPDISGVTTSFANRDNLVELGR